MDLKGDGSMPWPSFVGLMYKPSGYSSRKWSKEYQEPSAKVRQEAKNTQPINVKEKSKSNAGIESATMFANMVTPELSFGILNIRKMRTRRKTRNTEVPAPWLPAPIASSK
mmetsp:Transcript_52997/g.127578  ORF Transcript_52997/g.127578 Transcript_52997/m.127578 type:complete len:111 (+) Transcript_52997:383-715(+)